MVVVLGCVLAEEVAMELRKLSLHLRPLGLARHPGSNQARHGPRLGMTTKLELFACDSRQQSASASWRAFITTSNTGTRHAADLFLSTSNQLPQLHRGHRARLPQCTAHQPELQQLDPVRNHRRYITASRRCLGTLANHVVDVKLQLSPAYGDFLNSLPPNPSTSALAAKTTDKLVAEFRYLQANATGSLSKFMEYLTYGYMIDNVALLITGTLHERDTRELLERCHPLGWFETMPVLCVATNIEELYNSVLIETPLAPYFKGSLSHQDLDELNIEIIRNTLYKNYLEDFHQWINSCSDIAGTPTSDVMSEVLEFEADRRSINISLNSFGTELSKADRKKLYPAFGKLYPEGTLMLSRADDVEGVRIAVESVADYKMFFDQTGLSGGGGGGVGNMAGGVGGETRSLEDLFYQKEMEISKLAFTHQFTHAIVYAWVKLREQVCCQISP